MYHAAFGTETESVRSSAESNAFLFFSFFVSFVAENHRTQATRVGEGEEWAKWRSSDYLL